MFCTGCDFGRIFSIGKGNNIKFEEWNEISRMHRISSYAFMSNRSLMYRARDNYQVKCGLMESHKLHSVHSHGQHARLTISLFFYQFLSFLSFIVIFFPPLFVSAAVDRTAQSIVLVHNFYRPHLMSEMS